jgi:hypothetical protein
MHNPGMSSRAQPSTFFYRLRRSQALRVVLLVTTLLASQSSFACALEAAFTSSDFAAIAIVIDDQSVAIETSGDACCSLCFDCTNCGGCFGQMLNPRDVGIQLSNYLGADSKIGLTTAAPHLWASPTPLRPPIDLF